MANVKTNAVRILERTGIRFNTYSYEWDGKNAPDGKTVAEMMGQDPGQVFKTLVARGASGNYYVFDIPVLETLDLKKAAKAAGDKNMELVAVKELLGLTGYVRGGCSPVGMKKRYPVYIDETCELYDEIALSAGERGHQMLVPPMDLARFLGAKLVDITD